MTLYSLIHNLLVHLSIPHTSSPFIFIQPILITPRSTFSHRVSTSTCSMALRVRSVPIAHHGMVIGRRMLVGIRVCK